MCVMFRPCRAARLDIDRVVSGLVYRCSKLNCRATRADEQPAELKLSRRALQSELLAAFLVTVHAGWRPENAMADSQQITESADQEPDLTITDKVSCDQMRQVGDTGFLQHNLPAGVSRRWLMS